MTLTLFWIILFVVIGVVLIGLEIVAIPGTTVVGIAGAGLLVFAVWCAYTTYGSTTGHIVLASSLLASVCLLVLFLRAKTWKRLSLNDTIDSKVNLINNEKITVGAIGKSISRLAPSGKALINEEIVEVHTFSEFIDENSTIEIIRIEGAKIFVKAIQN